MGVIYSSITLLSQAHHLLPRRCRGGVGWQTAPVAMGQGGSAFFSIGCQQSPGMAFAYPQKFCGLGHGPAALQYSIQNL
jgi:hypothetical protein